MDKKFILSVIVIFVVSMLLGFITHGWALKDEYMATGIYRPEAEQQAMMVWNRLLLGFSYLPMSVAFVVLYRKGRVDKPWLGQGLRFGFWIAMFAAVGVYMIYYVVLPTPELLVFRQAVYDTINLMVMGLVVAFMYR